MLTGGKWGGPHTPAGSAPPNLQRAQVTGAPPDSLKPQAQAERAPRKGGGPCRKDPRVTTPLYSRACGGPELLAPTGRFLQPTDTPDL